ncbi:hypothetical protein CDAR_275381 [Caerostris darwini]|uniref:Uncharacterized protein n=1 Tax=Caerostris darwini TaxID=1538125 RepID=A0AAV4UMN1_9ARAC|nr:hypothetical protein CDAR_275381 [Caerostris darwini]
MFVTEFCRIRKHWPLQAPGNLIRPAPKPCTEPPKKVYRPSCTSKDVLKQSGYLFKDCRVCDVRSSEWTDSNIKDLWDRTPELILSNGIKSELPPDEDEEADNSEVADSKQ